MIKLFLLFLIAFISNVTIAQTGKITVKIISTASGLPLESATVNLIEKNKTDKADQNGAFTFSKLESGNYSIKCSYLNHTEKIVEEIIVKNNEETYVVISLELKKNQKTNKEVTVVGVSRVKAVGETNASLLVMQKNTANVMDGVTQQTIKTTPDKAGSDVIKRVSGASIQDDKFAVIRGLNDRYNASFINGAPLPSTESDRKAFAFDIFPSSIMDNLVIYKTATPDKTGDFAGGIIDISTKGISPKEFTTISIGTSHNSLITGKERFFSENKGKMDWIGIDDGIRNVPNDLKNVNSALTQQQLGEEAKKFAKYKWGINRNNTLPAYNLQFAKGFNIERKGAEFFGAVIAINYNRNFSFNATNRDVYNVDASGLRVQTIATQDSVYNDEVIGSALANFSIKLNNKNVISFKNNFSINTDNKLVKRIFAPDLQGDPTNGLKEKVRSYISNQILSSQLIGEHSIGNTKTKLNWIINYSKVNRDMPSFAISRSSFDFTNPVSPEYFGGNNSIFSKLNETIKSAKFDYSIPYKLLKSTGNNLKIGMGYQNRNRDFATFNYSYTAALTNFDFSLLDLPEDKIFSSNNMGKLANGKNGFVLGGTKPETYNAESKLLHGYLMNDQRLFKNLRLIYGVRWEKFQQKMVNKTLNLNVDIVTNTTVEDLLPSINAVYALSKKINFRLSYANTINRPEFRELADYAFLNFEEQYNIGGWSKIKRATIKNYDLRFEIFPGKAQLFTVSAFAKEFTNPIELLFNPGFDQVFYANVESGKAYGLEAEFRTLLSSIFGGKNEKSILNKLTLSANAAYIKSEVKIGQVENFQPNDFIDKRQLQGQSPYLINSSLNYTNDKKGISTTLSFNRIGERLVIGGNKFTRRDLYEKPRSVIDYQVTKNFLKNKLEVKMNIKDFLAQNTFLYLNLDDDSKFNKDDIQFSDRKMPRTVSVSFTYKF
jgi:TonB-dependent receptor